jgi:hypothetical protein
MGFEGGLGTARGERGREREERGLQLPSVPSTTMAKTAWTMRTGRRAAVRSTMAVEGREGEGFRLVGL